MDFSEIKLNIACLDKESEKLFGELKKLRSILAGLTSRCDAKRNEAGNYRSMAFASADDPELFSKHLESAESCEREAEEFEAKAFEVSDEISALIPLFRNLIKRYDEYYLVIKSNLVSLKEAVEKLKSAGNMPRSPEKVRAALADARSRSEEYYKAAKSCMEKSRWLKSICGEDTSQQYENDFKMKL